MKEDDAKKSIFLLLNVPDNWSLARDGQYQVKLVWAKVNLMKNYAFMNTIKKTVEGDVTGTRGRVGMM